MSEALSIRTLKSVDLADILSIWNRALVRDTVSQGRLVSMIYGDPDYQPGKDSGFFVATRGGKQVGFLRAVIRHWPNDRVGLEPEDGWISVVAVDPDHQRQGVGTALLQRALDYFRKHGRKKIWVCGHTGSAPGYTFCGVDKDAYPGGLKLLTKAGFKVRNEPVSMTREVVTFDVDGLAREAAKACPEAEVVTLTPERIDDFFNFLAECFPGDWNTAARAKVRAGLLHEVLIAILNGKVVGYCQWEGEHFGPFGVASEVRNKKIGARIFIEAVRRIRQADGRTAWFNWADEDAARFYRRFGMQAQRHFAILTKDL